MYPAPARRAADMFDQLVVERPAARFIVGAERDGEKSAVEQARDADKLPTSEEKIGHRHLQQID